MVGFADALMVAHFDARGGPVRELWRVIGPVYLSIRFISPRFRDRFNVHNGVIQKTIYVFRRLVPMMVAYLLSVWNGPSYSAITFSLLLLEKGLFEIDSLYQNYMARTASLMVRSVLGIHMHANWTFFAGLLVAAYRRSNIYATLGMVLNMLSTSLPAIDWHL